MMIFENGGISFSNPTSGAYAGEAIVGQGSTGRGLDEKGSNISMQEVATGVGAFSLANGVKGNLVEWGMKGANWGKAGARYVKYVKGFGYVGAGLTTTYTVGTTLIYYYNGGTDWKVGTKATFDVVMTGASFFWPIGTAISGAYFILDISTGGFGGFGEIKP